MLKAKELFFLKSDAFIKVESEGKIYIALRPFCRMLKIDYNCAYTIARKNMVLEKKLTKIKVLVKGRKYEQYRELVFLEEKYFVGWFFMLPITSEEALKYSLKCYEILYNNL